MEAYQPVPDALYEELKTLAALRERCALRFLAQNGGLVSTETKIFDVFRDSDGEFLMGENGFTLPLNQLISVNGQAVETFC